MTAPPVRTPGLRYGDNGITKPTIHLLGSLARRVYATDGHGAGGCMHIVLDDANLRNHHIASCLKSANDAGCMPCLQFGVEFIEASQTQRRKLLRVVRHAWRSKT